MRKVQIYIEGVMLDLFNDEQVNLNSTVQNISDISKVSNNYIESKKTITKIPHPELLEVKRGDELMVVNFKEQDQSDPIYKSLQERIDELTEEEDEEDDDGDVVVRT